MQTLDRFAPVLVTLVQPLYCDNPSVAKTATFLAERERCGRVSLSIDSTIRSNTLRETERLDTTRCVQIKLSIDSTMTETGHN